MSDDTATRERLYRAYVEFVDVAERKRQWNPFSDIPWDRLASTEPREERALCVETFCGVEMYVPDYASRGLEITRRVPGEAWFQARWAYEESKHALVFREYLVRSGLRTQMAYDAFEARVLDQRWTLPFPTVRQMTCYGALQEAVTYLIYHAQREQALRDGDEILERVFFYVARDEAAHRDFYRRCLEISLADDRDATLTDLARVLTAFRMPAADLIPDYTSRCQVAGVAITPAQFLTHGISPLLKQLGTSRAEVTRAALNLRSPGSGVSCADPAPTR